MTCIAAWVEDNCVWMGADSANTTDNMIHARIPGKLLKRNGLLLGVSGNARINQLVAHSLDIPAHKKGQTDYSYIAITLVNALQNILKSTGTHYIEDGHESAQMAILVAYRGRLYIVGSHYAAYRTREQYLAAGSGTRLATGAFYAMKDYDIPPRTRVLLALKAAAHFDPYIAPPFTIMVQKKKAQ